jgi:hypothetical protein
MQTEPAGWLCQKPMQVHRGETNAIRQHMWTAQNSFSKYVFRVYENSSWFTGSHLSSARKSIRHSLSAECLRCEAGNLNEALFRSFAGEQLLLRDVRSPDCITLVKNVLLHFLPPAHGMNCEPQARWWATEDSQSAECYAAVGLL